MGVPWLDTIDISEVYAPEAKWHSTVQDGL
jgi:hypothetical protein